MPIVSQGGCQVLRCEGCHTIHRVAVLADPSASSGEVFRVGDDVVYRDGGNRLRVVAVATPDKAYRKAFVEAVSVVARSIGEAVDIVLDFSGSAPPGPGQAVGLCRDLSASGDVNRIVILRHPDMPGWLLSAEQDSSDRGSTCGDGGGAMKSTRVLWLSGAVVVGIVLLLAIGVGAIRMLTEVATLRGAC